jgi:hypothetical protein
VHQVPEMQRVPLDDLCLQIKAIVTPTVVSYVKNINCREIYSMVLRLHIFLVMNV